MQERNVPSSALPRARHQNGLTLIEFMVSIAIGLILITGLVALMARQSATQMELEKSSRQIENGRYAMQLLQEDIQLAGYYGEYNAVIDPATLPATLPNPCSVAASAVDGALQLAIQGWDSPTTLPADLASASCSLNAANYLAGTDILVVRHADTTVAVDGALDVGGIYLQTGLTPGALPVIGRQLVRTADDDIDPTVFNLKRKDGTPAPLRRMLVHIYFISPCSVPKDTSTNRCSADNSDDGGVSVPTLKRLELTVASNAPTFRVVPLVEGIENMQIDYGVDTDGDGSPDDYVKNAGSAAAGDWANVMAVRVNLLARNNERTVGYQDNKVYQLGLAGSFATSAAAAAAGVTTFNALADGSVKRRVFSQSIRLVNPSARRER